MKTKTEICLTRVSYELKTKLKRYAEKNDMAESQVIRIALKKFLSKTT